MLQKVFERIDKKRDGKIDKDELLEYLLRVKYEPVKVNQYGVSEVEHMYEIGLHSLAKHFFHFSAGYGKLMMTMTAAYHGTSSNY